MISYDHAKEEQQLQAATIMWFEFIAALTPIVRSRSSDAKANANLKYAQQNYEISKE
jgi:hypothetical protein